MDLLMNIKPVWLAFTVALLIGSAATIFVAGFIFMGLDAEGDDNGEIEGTG